MIGPDPWVVEQSIWHSSPGGEGLHVSRVIQNGIAICHVVGMVTRSDKSVPVPSDHLPDTVQKEPGASMSHHLSGTVVWEYCPITSHNSGSPRGRLGTQNNGQPSDTGLLKSNRRCRLITMRNHPSRPLSWSHDWCLFTLERELRLSSGKLNYGRLCILA